MQINGGHSAFDTQFLPPVDPLPPEARKGWIIVFAVLGVLVFGFWAFGVVSSSFEVFGKQGRIHEGQGLLGRVEEALLDLNRPANDVLERYDAVGQSRRFETYQTVYRRVRAELGTYLAGEKEATDILTELDSSSARLVQEAQMTLAATELREQSRLAGADEKLVREFETRAGVSMARMNQHFVQSSQWLQKLEKYLMAQERNLSNSQREHFSELYLLTAVSVLFGLMAVWLLVRVRTSRKREQEFSSSLSETVTELKTTETALKQSNERFHLAASAVSGAIYDWDIEKNSIVWSDGLTETFGHPLTEIGTTKEWHEAQTHPDDRENVRQQCQANLEGGRDFVAEYRFRCKKGQYLEVWDKGRVVKNDEGRVVRMVGSIVDVTEQKKTEKALRSIVEGTSSSSGADFFRSLTRHLASALDVRWVLIGEVVGSNQERIKTLAFWKDGDFALECEYELAGTPCDEVVGKATCCYPKGVAGLFPEDRMLSEIGVESYLGTPLFDSAGKPLGILVVMHDQPLAEEGNLQSVLKIFASRASAELERQRAEEALRKAEEKYRGIFENAVEGIYQTTPEGRYQTANPMLAWMYGYTSIEEMMAADLNRQFYVQPERRAEFIRLLDEQGAIKGFESEVYRKDGGRMWISENARMVPDDQGRLLYYEGSVQDITERVRAQEELVRLASFPELTPSPIIEMDLAGRITYLNPAAQKQFPALQPLGFKHPILEGLESVLEKLKSNEAAMFAREIQVDGVVYEQKIYHDSRNYFTRIYAYDVTERKQAEQAIRENEERFRKIFSDAPIGMAIVGEDFRIARVNKSMYEMLDYPENELTGKTFVDITHPEDVEKDISFARKLFKGEISNYKLEKRYLKRSGEVVWINLTATVIRDASGGISYGLAMVEDISERKRVEGEMARARDAALEQARLKSEFLANMSHEIRTPMNGVLGYLGLLTTRAFGDENEMMEFVEGAKTSADSLLTLINDILDFSKIEAGKLNIESIEFDLRSVVEETAQLLAPRAQQKGIELACLVEFGVPLALKGDPTRLRQVLINLTGNAVKFTEKGEVVIRASLVDETDGEAKIRFSVKDTGIGIPAEKHHLLFQSFTQVDGSSTRRYGGTGLGLAISRQLVELMGGGIGFDSAPGKGSEFWFEAKLSKNLAVRPRLVSADVKNLPVLVVDDNAVNRDILCRMLESFGCRSFSAAGGQEALTILQKKLIEGDPIRLAVIDFQMPEEDGRELANKIKSNAALCQMALMLLTSVGTRGDAAMAREAGFAAYLHKPVKQSQLLEAIAAIVGRQSMQEDSTPHPLITRHWLEEVRRSGTILLAEDNPVNQAVAEAILSRAGYTIVTVKDGREAVEVLSERDFDLVLMDVQMPEMDGLEATGEIRKLPGGKSKIPIIAMTAHALSGDREKCLEAGMNDYVSKPINPLELKEMVERWLKRENTGPAGGAAVGVRNPEESPVDFGRLSQSSGGDLEFERRLTELFLSDVERRIALLDESTSAGREEKSLAEAHSLKGACANFGAARLAGIFSELEVRAKNGERTEMRRLAGQARVEFKRVKEFLSQRKRVEA